jgi:lysyl endopeptidase
MQRQFYAGLLCLAALAATPAAAYDLADFPWLSERKILGVNNLEPVAAAQGTDAYDLAQAIARVEMIADGFGFCTGSRVGTDLFITNFHCDQGCDDMQFKLGYEVGVDAADQQIFKCKELIRKNEKFDYALYRVHPTTSESEIEYPILTLSRSALSEGQRMIVASHPSGRLKEIDRSDECYISSTEVFTTESGRDTIKHMCDTEGGSSGSPVLDRDTGHFVALHWGGRTNEFNMAIPMYLILEDLENNLTPEALMDLDIAQ